MRTVVTIAAVLAAALSLAVAAAPVGAAAPDRQTYNFSGDYTDSDLCGFAVKVHYDFTNMIIDSSQATGTLQLHQRDAETWSAKGVTLRASGDYTIFVTFANGIPQTVKKVGLLDDITAPNGEHLFFRTGEAVYQVVYDPGSGYYVDGPLLARHGVRDNFDAARICAAFG
jgi:hypothetical protein